MAMESGETNSRHSNKVVKQDQSSSSKGQSTEWIIRIEKMLGSWEGRPLDLRIFKVPYKLRKVNEAAYCPQIVSIGPFHASSTTRSFLPQELAMKNDQHRAAKKDDNWQRKSQDLILPEAEQKHGKKHDDLMGMQENKWCYMLFFLQRTSDPKKTLHDLGAAIKDQEENVRLSYAEGIKFGSDELAEMMLVDGCFILELFIRSWFKNSPNEHDFLSWFKHSPFEGDPIFYNSWMLSALRRDLTLLENQIPFFILQTLYDNFMKERKPHENTCCQKIEIPSITLLAISFFRPDLELNLKPELWESTDKCSQLVVGHLLDLLHKFYLSTVCKAHPAPAPAPAKSKELNLGFREGARRLLEAGITFEKVTEENFLDSMSEAHLKIELNEKGVIKIPPLRIDEITESRLRNLIAFEQCIPRSGYLFFSSYAILLKSLVQRFRDFQLLEKKKIITNNLGVIRKVEIFFYTISTGVDLKARDFYFGKLCDDVNEFQDSRWHLHKIITLSKRRGVRYLKALKKDYLSNPWKILSVIAAVVLLLFTGVQTYYTVQSYVRPH